MGTSVVGLGGTKLADSAGEPRGSGRENATNDEKDESDSSETAAEEHDKASGFAAGNAHTLDTEADDTKAADNEQGGTNAFHQDGGIGSS